jgi:hypothetical protein
MEANLLGSGLTINILELSLGEFAAEVFKYMEAREKSKRKDNSKAIGDLRWAYGIVKKLTSQYIDLMQEFYTREVVIDKQALAQTTKEAKKYLQERKLLPNLDILIGSIGGKATLFSPAGWALRNAHKELGQFRQSLLGNRLKEQEKEKILITGVGLEALQSRIAKAKEFQKKPPSEQELEQFIEATERMLNETNVSASSRVYESIGRAIGKLKS